MFLVNGIKAILIQYDRSGIETAYDDQDKRETAIKVCPYNISRNVEFGIYTVPNASGYFQVKNIDVKEGDQVKISDTRYPELNNKIYTVLDVQYNWFYNKILNKVIAVK